MLLSHGLVFFDWHNVQKSMTQIIYLGPLAHCLWHWACQCTDTGAFLLLSDCALYKFCFFYLCSLQILFFLGFRQWRSRAESVAESYILTQPSDFHCFGELELGPRQALAHMCWPVAIHKGRDYRNCRASELSNCQVSGLVFSWFTKLSKIQKKWRHCKRRF